MTLAIRQNALVVAELSPESGEPTRTHEPEHRGWVRLLSDRQRAVMQLVAWGDTEKHIARTLGIGVWIVKAEKGRARKLLGARDVPHAVYLALHAGLIA